MKRNADFHIENEQTPAEDAQIEKRSLVKDTKGLAAYVAVAVLIAMALLVYAGAKQFGDAASEKFEGQAGAVESIPASLSGGGE